MNKDLYTLMEKISNTTYYEGNKQRSIEHIQKVMLFAELLAEGEQLSEKDRKLLLVAVAFHDSARDGQEGNNIEHGEGSAILAGRVLKENNDYGNLSPSEIAMIQTAIHYHTYREEKRGMLNKHAIEKFAKTYAKYNGIEELDLKRTAKICELLKDADALDRYRFARRGTLDARYLRSKTAKRKSTMEYAKFINEKVAEKILRKIYKFSEEEISKHNPIGQLRNVRISKQMDEGHLEFSELKEIYDREFPRKREADIDGELLQLYFEKDTSVEEVNKETQETKANFGKEKSKNIDYRTEVDD